jgi:hypothetical protein
VDSSLAPPRRRATGPRLASVSARGYGRNEGAAMAAPSLNCQELRLDRRLRCPSDDEDHLERLFRHRAPPSTPARARSVALVKHKARARAQTPEIEPNPRLIEPAPKRPTRRWCRIAEPKSSGTTARAVPLYTQGVTGSNPVPPIRSRGRSGSREPPSLMTVTATAKRRRAIRARSTVHGSPVAASAGRSEIRASR